MPPPTRNAERAFVVGETVHLRSRVSLPGTRTPADPGTVQLTTLARDGVQILGAPTPFVRQDQGEYTLAIPTAELPPGTYTLAVTHADGADRVTISTDAFVLHPAP